MRTSRRLRRAAAVATLVVLGLTAGCSGEDGQSSTATESSASATDRGASDAEALAATAAGVRTAVEQAEADAPVPTVTSPELGDDLLFSRADLGECDYGAYDTDSGPLCERGVEGADQSFAVLGDSHGRHWAPALDQIAKRDGWSAHYLVKQQCTASLVSVGDPREASPQEPWAACTDFREWALDQLADLDPDVVIVSTSPPVNGVFTGSGFTRDRSQQIEAYRQGFDELFARIKDVTTDARIVLLKDVPVRSEETDPQVCLTTAGNDLGDCLSAQDADEAVAKLTQASVRAAAGSDVEVVDPTPLFCWEGSCPVVIGDDTLPYRGTSHVTVEYAATLADPLASLLGL